jgi:hypothetical protein
MSPIAIGIEIEVVDELAPVAAPTATDTCFVLHTEATELVTVIGKAAGREAFDGMSVLTALSDAFFEEGGGRLIAAPYNGGSGDSLEDDLDQFGPELGPGQIVVPEVVTGIEMGAIASWAYAANRLYIADGPEDATDSELEALAATLRTSEGARFAEMEADTLTIPGLAAGSTREVPASIVKAAIMARNDIATGNPNLAAAGIDSRCAYVLGVVAERTEAERNTLADSGINCFRTYVGAIMPYGYRTVADPDDLPVWWDVSGSRTVMAVRAREAGVAEAHTFRQIDGSGAFLASYEASLARELKELQTLGALFATSATDPGYRVSAGWDVNPREDVAQGIVRARITMRTSPFAEHLTVSIIRRPITQEA